MECPPALNSSDVWRLPVICVKNAIYGGQVLTQLYEDGSGVTVDGRFPYYVYGCQQDNSCVALPSRTDSSGIARHHWYVIGGCESGHVAIDPRDPNVTYSGCYGGQIDRYDHRTGQERQIMAYPQLAVGQKAEDLRYRFQWNAPIRLSPHDPDVLYHASQFVHRSTDQGQSWQAISPDLSRNDATKQGYAGGGARTGLSYFVDGDLPLGYAREAVRQAIVQMEAEPAPAGTMPVVLGKGWPGILLHEAVGHGLEGDFNRKGVSAFSGRIGQKVASEQCTIVDDGTIANRRGSLSVDDEGTPGQNTVLVENGILRSYLHDRISAEHYKLSRTGSARRESYKFAVAPRMRNTYMLNGPRKPDEIIASVKRGLYADERRATPAVKFGPEVTPMPPVMSPAERARAKRSLLVSVPC